MKRLALLAAAVAVGVIAVAALTSSGSAAPPGQFTTLTFTEIEKGSTFKLNDLPPLSRLRGFRMRVSVGDEFVFGNTLVDSAGHRAGRVEGFCKALRRGRNFGRARWGCQGFARLAAGTLDISADFKPSQTIRGSINGGTGSYEGATGSFSSSGEPATDTFHFTTK